MTNAQDEFAMRFLDAPNTEEALAWLQGGSPMKPRLLGEDEDIADSTQRVEELYAAGAKQVLAVAIDHYDDGENTGKLVIELSDNPTDREKVLGIAGRIAESQGFVAAPDNGQRYVFVMLD